ncbi:serine/threonine protein kinase, putative [Plasmodium gaboni]|uniref:non-specific serine/threonine protein kinase n=1 Tax=Plasmodium gaboni TaxID=647221 RepID=A0ABY1UQ16_9APIC|nr:serine/threonine protein kinase, putative [Plasmodium gaboni]
MKKGFLLNKNIYDIEENVINVEKNNINKKYCKDDFETYMHIGTGNFSDVFMVKLKNDPSKKYALKIFKKEKVNKMNKVNDVLTEKNVMSKLNIPGHANVIKLIETFKDKENVYLLYEYADYDLWEFLKIRSIGVNEKITFNIILQMVHALEYIHNKNIIHRDLKCENFLINKDGTIKMIDFGTSKDLDNISIKTNNEEDKIDHEELNKFVLKKNNNNLKENLKNESEFKNNGSLNSEEFNSNDLNNTNFQKSDKNIKDQNSNKCVLQTLKNNESYEFNNKILEKENAQILSSFKSNDYAEDTNTGNNYRKKKTFENYVGSPNFIPPEALINKCSGKARDFWSLGCTIYQLATCTVPFDGSTEWFIYNKIKKRELKYPSIIPSELIDLIEKLTTMNPEERLGFNGGCKEILEHSYFQKYNYDKLNFILPEVSEVEKLYTTIINKYHIYINEKRKLRQDNYPTEENTNKVEVLKKNLLNLINSDTLNCAEEEYESITLKKKIFESINFMLEESDKQEIIEMEEANKWLERYQSK